MTVKHISIRLTWHDDGWNGKSCKDPENNLSCQQDKNQFIHKTKVILNNTCCTDISRAKAYINDYLRKNECFLNSSKIGYVCKIHNNHLLNENGNSKSSICDKNNSSQVSQNVNSISEIPPCDSFATFREKNPYVHTKNPARALDEYDKLASQKCSRGKEPWEYIKNWRQVNYFPQDYRKHIVNGSSVALFYTVNFPEESGKFVLGYSVIKNKNEDFASCGKGKTTIFNKSNAGNLWGEEWCFILDENDRYRFPFQELIETGNFEALERLKNILKVEPQDERFFRNLSLFIPDHILIKYLKKLKQAVSILELYGIDPETGGDFSKIDTKIQQLTKAYLSFKYPGLPTVGRFLYWWNAYKDYEDHIKFEEVLKESFFKALKTYKYIFKVNGKKFFLGSSRKGIHPKNELLDDFIEFLEDSVIYYPINNEKVIERIKLLIDKNILDINQIKQNPYTLYEEFIPSLDGNISLSFEDIDYGEYKKSINRYLKSNRSDSDKNDVTKSFCLNPYRIRALIHEYFKVYKDDPGFVWISFKDIENYIRKRLSSGLGTGKFELNFEEILNTPPIKETVEIDFEKRFLTLKKLAKIEKDIERKIKNLIKNSTDPIHSPSHISIKDKIKNIIGNIPENDLKEKEEAIKRLLTNRFTFISGVAGAGKSTLIKIFTEILKDLGEEFKILTPTGKASERLRQEGLESETIHYFLKENGFIDNELFIFNEKGKTQEIQNLIIDEISMVPLDLLYNLLGAVNLKKLKRLIFVGDIKQLPPIGYGYPAKDIYSFLEKNHPENLIKLEKSYRSKDRFIYIANKLRNENLTPEDIQSYFTESINNNNFQILKFSSQQDLENLIRQILKKEKITKEKLAKDPEIFQILTPKKEGYTGSNHLNRYVSNILSNGKFSWKNTKVIKLINTYCPAGSKNCVETFNGMIGTVFYENGWKVKFKGGQVAPFSSEKMGYEYDYAYGITIHKSQGSEFNTVVVILPENIGNLFTRELLYTALTRARSKLHLLVENEDLLYEVPLEIERSGKLFQENLLELPETAGYTAMNGSKILSKLDLYISTILELNGISHKYKTPRADFEIGNKRVHIINLNTYQGKIKNKFITENKENIKLTYKRYIDIKSFIRKLGIDNYPDRQKENRVDYREKIRSNLIKEQNIHIEPDTNFIIKTHNGLETRSISESILMLMFDHYGINYLYEKEIKINGKLLLPDFYFPDSKIFLEHLGLLDDLYYLARWKEKKKVYEKSGYKVIHLKDWNGEMNVCLYTTEEDIKNLKKLWNNIKRVLGEQRKNI